jgi:rod shape-determining protein MreC
LLIVSTRTLLVGFMDVGLSAFSGVRSGIYRVSSVFSNAVASVEELITAKKNYAQLSAEYTRLQELEKNAAAIREENYSLREQLEFTKKIEYNYIAAEVSAHDIDSLYAPFVINKGEKSGIKVNMPVVASNNGEQVLVGKVTKTSPYESVVLPLYDAASFVSARVAPSRNEGIVEGAGSAEKPLVMRYVTKKAQDELHIGDTAITSGLGGVFPAGLRIGRVERIISQEYASSLELELTAAANFSKLEFVFVIDATGGDTAASDAAASGVSTAAGSFTGATVAE